MPYIHCYVALIVMRLEQYIKDRIANLNERIVKCESENIKILLKQKRDIYINSLGNAT